MKPTSGEKACGFLAFRGLSAAPLGGKDMRMYCIHSLGDTTCREIARGLGCQLLGKMAVCTSVDSGPGGWDGWNDKIGNCFYRKIDAAMIADWPTYWGAYDEWYVFDALPSGDFAVIPICNFAGSFIEDVGSLEDSCDWAPKITEYLHKYHPVCILGNNEGSAYLIASTGLMFDPAAQQGDAPEPATNADPASRPPSAPAR